MFKEILTVLVLFSLCFRKAQVIEFPNPQADETDRERLLYAKYKIKKIEVFKYDEAIKTESDSTSNLIETRTLDANGYLVYSKKLEPNGRDVIVNQKFDSLGNLLSFKQFMGERFFHESKYYYNSSNTLISRVTINFSGKRDSIAQNNRIEYSKGKKITTNSDGAMASKVIEEYDDKKGLLKSTTYGNNGSPIQIWEYELNENGQILSKNILKSMGNGGVEKVINSYDKNDLLIEIKSYNQKQELTRRITNEYSVKGLLTKQITEDLEKDEMVILTYRYQ